MNQPMEFSVPIETPSTANSREHWAAKAGRVKNQRQAVSYLMPAEARSWRPVLLVTLTRVAPRSLDTDNLQGALKAVRDQVASGLGVDDRTTLVEWRYRQERGGHCVRIRIEEIGT